MGFLCALAPSQASFGGIFMSVPDEYQVKINQQTLKSLTPPNCTWIGFGGSSDAQAVFITKNEQEVENAESGFSKYGK